MKFFIINDKIVKTGETDLTRFFAVDPIRISQKIWYGFGGIPLFYENLQSLFRQINALKLPLPAILEDDRELFRIAKRMLNKNKQYRSGYIHVQLFWNEKETHTLITSKASQESDFPFHAEGRLLSYSGQKKNAANAFNRYPFFNRPLWNATLAETAGTHFHNAMILNEKNAVCECAFANIYLIRNNEIITPPPESGCYEDVLRPFILETARQLGLTPQEANVVKKNDPVNMDELFMAGEQTGIQWILGIENKRFLHQISTKIHERLNDLLREKAKI